MSRAPENLPSLIRAATEGSKEAQGELLQWNWSLLTNRAGKRLDRQLKAKIEESDLVQETFLEALRRFPTLKGRSEGELAAWLDRILIHDVQDTHRSYWHTRKRDVRRETPLSEHIAEQLPARGQKSPEGIDETAELGELMWRGLELLSTDHQLVVLLHHVKGMPFKVIAPIMQRSVDAVRQLCTRAVGNLRKATDSLAENKEVAP